MNQIQALDLTFTAAMERIRSELSLVAQALQAGDPEVVIDGHVRALGLALQLGPVPAQEIITALLYTVSELARHREGDILAMLGPALVGLVDQINEAGALPSMPGMAAWAAVASDLGSLVGQIGLVLALPPSGRAAMLNLARRRALLLDEATNGILELEAWYQEIAASIAAADGQD
jgi:hypothetical protein